MTKQSMQPAVYIMANKPYGTLYTGVTSDLVKRAWQHREETHEGFTARYGCKRLVYFQLHETMETAITREKAIKGGSRQRKINLVISTNPDWTDLYDGIA